jgi:hypothetical protein
MRRRRTSPSPSQRSPIRCADPTLLVDAGRWSRSRRAQSRETAKFKSSPEHSRIVVMELQPIREMRLGCSALAPPKPIVIGATTNACSLSAICQPRTARHKPVYRKLREGPHSEGYLGVAR